MYIDRIFTFGVLAMELGIGIGGVVLARWV